MGAVIPVGPPYKVLLHFQIVPLYISLCKGAEEAGVQLPLLPGPVQQIW